MTSHLVSSKTRVRDDQFTSSTQVSCVHLDDFSICISYCFRFNMLKSLINGKVMFPGWEVINRRTKVSRGKMKEIDEG